MKNIIKALQDSDLYFRILEVGAGMPVSNELFKHEGASKIIYSAESYYAKEAFDNQFGQSSHRSVSAEHLSQILNDDQVRFELSDSFYNSILASSFQLGPQISNHGWFLIHTPKITRYYHVSLGDSSREYNIARIGEIGLNLMYNLLQPQTANNCEIDIILDENLIPLIDETLEFISKSDINDICTVFTSQGSIERLEYITRVRDNKFLILYKGSFNPISVSHLNLMKAQISLNTNDTIGVFCLSFNTFQKGKQEVQSFINRIRYINKCGYSVIVNNKPFFKDLHRLITAKYNRNIEYIMGSDTLLRFAEDYYCNNRFFNTYELRRDFQIENNTKFFVYNRDNYELPKELKSLDGVFINDNPHPGCSSTMIRKALVDGNYDLVKSLVPQEIYSDLLSTFCG